MFSTMILSLILGQPLLPPLPDEKKNPVIGAAADYNSALASARKARTPIVIFQGVPVRKVKGAVYVEVSWGRFSLKHDYPDRCIIVGNQDGQWLSTLPFNATDADIEKALEPRRVAFVANPFLRPGEVAPPDDDSDAVGLLPMLKTMEKYEPTKYTQHTQRRVSGYISPVLRRNALELKWVVPGNMVGVQGWSSTVYRVKGIRAAEFLVQDPSEGSVGTVTWSKSYPDGAKFAEVLRNIDGKIFEVRLAEKDSGRWTRETVHRNAAMRPDNYAPPSTKDCRTCHSQAGIAAYGTAANPGGDEILGDAYRTPLFYQTVQGGNRTQL